MPNYAYSLIKLTANNDAAKQQLHEFIKKHLVFSKARSFMGSNIEVDSKSIIPLPDGIAKLEKMGELLFHDDGSFEKNPNYDKNAFDAQRKANIEQYGYEDWYGFCIDKWGSKWGLCNTTFYNDFGEEINSIEEITETLDENGYIKFKAATAWSPALGLLQKICELYPDIELRCEWGEEQVTEYYGLLTYNKTDGGREYGRTDIEVGEAYDMLDRLGLVNKDDDDGYYPNYESGLVEYDSHRDKDSEDYVPLYEEPIALGCEQKAIGCDPKEISCEN